MYKVTAAQEWLVLPEYATEENHISAVLNKNNKVDRELLYMHNLWLSDIPRIVNRKYVIFKINDDWVWCDSREFPRYLECLSKVTQGILSECVVGEGQDGYTLRIIWK